MEQFKKLGITKSILEIIEKEKFEEPTEIQVKSIPLAIAGKDIIAGSATGSGKTLAFGAGIIQNSVKGRGIQALILTPTRELADQISQALKKFAKGRSLRILAIYGGVGINPQIHRLETADIVVGTPGRILDHLQRRTIELRDVKTLILDEADRMLDMGFKDDVERIIGQCPKKRQTLLFSATISSEIARISRKYMNDPIKVSAESYVDASKLSQEYYDVPENMKFSLLAHLLRDEKAGLVMIFCNTRRNVDFVANNLKLLGIDSMPIHGGFSQDKRTKTINRFHSKESYVLVCTDVAARGLDIPNVSHVYNYDIPKDSKEYIHRVGRTARAGKDGKVINILTRPDHDNFTRVLRDNELKIKKLKTPEFSRAKIGWKEAPRQFGRGGSRGGRSSGRSSYGGRRDSDSRRSFGSRRDSGSRSGSRRDSSSRSGSSGYRRDSGSGSGSRRDSGSGRDSGRRGESKPRRDSGNRSGGGRDSGSGKDFSRRGTSNPRRDSGNRGESGPKRTFNRRR
ncbi:MAG: DEAD/DEAH box helicase [Nanoarchaeota archaeon]|nr:DEAD/DEAH box helicase [Nanoarchaeota archaeon]